MALLDNVFKQRMIGALVLIALAVVFLPMLFSREDEQHQVRVDPPAAPLAPVVPEVKVEPVEVPEPQIIPEEPVASAQAPRQAPSMPIAPAPTQPATAPAARPAPAQPAAPAVAPRPAAAASTPAAAPAPVAKADAARVDGNGLPVSWSVQLASLSNRANAESLQKTLRSQGYNAYVRSADGKNRVFVGPLIERAEAERLRDVINRQQQLKGFVVRFEPERG